ncbi:MAG: DNA/RNA non-specific endonuclease [Candidatus Eremiobacteraeota bacterium]|nr:DNA/RNA non-specific endonuclease [Candidatus Eremiobacteraeota bacterium]
MTDSSAIGRTGAGPYYPSSREAGRRDDNEKGSVTPQDTVTLGKDPGASVKQSDIHRAFESAIERGPATESKNTEKSSSTEDAEALYHAFPVEGGYEESFLGGDKKVPFPKMTDDTAETVLHFGREGETVRNYTHFSIVMNKDRKMALFTANNLDGKSLRDDIKRGKWEIDEIIGAENQLGDYIYSGNNLDRGHMVRRRDVVWGDRQEATRANNDTFFFPNAVPQHGSLNQNNWHDLENWLLQRADQQEKRLSVFTGPVFSSDDISYRGSQLPGEFWKIVILERESDHKLAAAAFMMSQKELIQHINNKKTPQGRGGGESQDMVDTSAVAPYQVTIDTIEKATGLDFGDLKDIDAYALFQEEQGRRAGSRPAAATYLESDAAALLPELSRHFIASPGDIII